MNTIILPPPRESIPPLPRGSVPVMTPVEIDRIVRSTTREALAWLLCVGFVLGLVAMHIILTW